MKSPESREVILNVSPLSRNTRIELDLTLLPKNDYNSLIDIKFQFTILNLVCKQKSSDISLLILVHSSVTHFSKRQVIRDTWGRASATMKIIFLTARASKEDVNVRLKRESDQFEDIVQGDFADTYHNITYKHTMGLKYAIYHCPEAKYVLKVDDDVFVNTPMLTTFLSEKVSVYGAKDVLMCILMVHTMTLRSYRSKWRISFEEYPHRYFPTFCRGLAIIYSPDVIFDLYKKAQEVKKYVKLDDVFYTGLTADSIGFHHFTDIKPLISFVYKEGKTYFPEELNTYLFVGSELDEEDLTAMWAQVEKEQREKLGLLR